MTARTSVDRYKEYWFWAITSVLWCLLTQIRYFQLETKLSFMNFLGKRVCILLKGREALQWLHKENTTTGLIKTLEGSHVSSLEQWLIPKVPHWFQRRVDIKARVMRVNQEYVLKYIPIISLLDHINKAG